MVITKGDRWIADVQSHLFKWHVAHFRKFPWRETTDAYRIILAEKLLQQTVAREKTVEIYGSIVTAFPTIYALAEADVGELSKTIAPLGFAYRAGELSLMAQQIVSLHSGEIPSSHTVLMELTGVGEYISRAVLSFAFDQDFAVVDTNVARWLFRLFGMSGKIPTNPARDRQLRNLAQEMLPNGNSRLYNFAVLDLCALVCKSRCPLCKDCPLRYHCVTGLASLGGGA